MLGAIVRAVLSPLLSLGEKYLDNQRDKARLEAGVTETAYQTDAAVRKVKLSHLLGRLPLFVAELACSLYIAAILLDSTFPMQWLTPLELPQWFKPFFHIVVISIFGIATFERAVRRK